MARPAGRPAGTAFRPATQPAPHAHGSYAANEERFSAALLKGTFSGDGVGYTGPAIQVPPSRVAEPAFSYTVGDCGLAAVWEAVLDKLTAEEQADGLLPRARALLEAWASIRQADGPPPPEASRAFMHRLRTTLVDHTLQELSGIRHWRPPAQKRACTEYAGLQDLYAGAPAAWKAGRDFFACIPDICAEYRRPVAESGLWFDGRWLAAAAASFFSVRVVLFSFRWYAAFGTWSTVFFPVGDPSARTVAIHFNGADHFQPVVPLRGQGTFYALGARPLFHVTGDVIDVALSESSSPPPSSPSASPAGALLADALHDASRARASPQRCVASSAAQPATCPPC